MCKQRRNTRTKQLILEVLAGAHSALSREEIGNRLEQKMDRVTLYRILQGFCDEGKLHRVFDTTGETFYALCHGCTAGNHHDSHPHFHCVECNEIVCIEKNVAQQELPPGYSALSAVSYVSGYCSKCSSLGKLIFLLAMLTINLAARSQTQVRVVDADNGNPVEFAAVYFPEMKTGCVTDSAGEFSVNLAWPQLAAQISALGYQTSTLNIPLREGRQTILLRPSVHELAEVVSMVSSSRLQGENVMNVEKLNLANLTVPGISLAGKLASVPGLENMSSGAGIGKPVIRGLSGNRIAVFSQGLRIENQQWGDEHGLGLSENGYEQVEIIKGPASLLYGSDALGGVLYFVDERYAADGTVEARISSEYASNTLGWNNNAALKLSESRFHLNIFGGYNSNADYTDGSKTVVPNSRFNTTNLKAVMGYTGQNFTSALKYGYLGERFGLTEADDDDEEDEHDPAEAINRNRRPEMPYQNLNTHYVSSENTLFLANGSKLKLDAGFLSNSRREFEHDHEPEADHSHDQDEPESAALSMLLSTFSWNLRWYSAMISDRWTITAGNQGMAQSNKNLGEEMLIPDATTVDLGTYALAAFHYAENSTLQTGVRFDLRNISADDQDGQSLRRDFLAVNFSAGLHQPINDKLTMRATISSGFRAPNMYELLSNGVHHGTNRHESGNPNLKTENSYQADMELTYSIKHISLFANPYLNYIRNYIHLQPTGQIIDEAPAYRYVQADSYLYGGEAGVHLHPHPLDWLHAETSFSSVYGQDRNGSYLSLIPSQKIRTTLSANFNPAEAHRREASFIRKISVYVQNVYSFAQNRVASPHESPTPAYNLLNAGIDLEVGIKSQLLHMNLAVNNLLSATYYDHLSRYKTNGVYDIGRNIHLKILIPVHSKRRGR